MDDLDERIPLTGNYWINSLIIFSLALICSKACGYINKKAGMKNDNVYEEIVEDIIKSKTGIELDLSPEEK